MTPLLRVFLFAISLVFLFFVLRMIRHDRLMLKYALLWIVLGFMGVLLAVFPSGAVWISDTLGFKVAANFVFLVMIVLLMGISLIYGAALSRQAVQTKLLIQEISVLKAELSKTDMDDDKDADSSRDLSR